MKYLLLIFTVAMLQTCDRPHLKALKVGAQESQDSTTETLEFDFK